MPGITADFVGLYDPVDMAEVIPDDESLVEPLIDRVAVIGPGPGLRATTANWDYPAFVRMSQGSTIRRELWNSHTIIAHSLMNASHGAIGGSPGYNDTGILSWGESVNAQYNYAEDRINGIRADELVRGGLRAEGWYVRDVGVNEYGFPLANPTSTTDFWQTLVGRVL